MLRTIFAAALIAAAAPAFAQDAAASLPDPNDQSDTLTLALGAAWIPDYEGSNDYRATPFAAIRARVSGISIFSRGTHLYVDVLRRPADGIDFDFGPIIGARMNRTGKIKDDFVDALPERKTAIEAGGFAGVTLHGVTNPYDALSFRFDAIRDVSNRHDSWLFSPSVEFGTPLSRHAYVGASLSGEWASGGYADYYYSITPADAVASGLPVYDAEGGLKQVTLGLLGNHSITGDLTGGLSAFAAGSFSRIAGDYADSPIVDQRGSRSQWRLAAGLAYTW